MKTSLDLPDELYRRLKARSALEGRTVREVATTLFSAWVEGRVELEQVPVGTTWLAPAPADDPRQAWLARWRSISDQVAQAVASEHDTRASATEPPAASPEQASLVRRLQTDRR
jgi:hypothetical protein